MLADIKRTNPKQHALIRDASPYAAALCPRRAGKSYAGAADALITGESKPDSISIIVSLNLKQLRRLYWSGAPSGLFTLNRKYGLNLEWNNSMLRWDHENGSIGYLMGAEDEEQLEVLRGMEADLYLIDECKSFVPSRLQKLLTEIIAPQRATRKGRVVLIGTPGHNLSGPFWEATDPRARDKEGRRFSVDVGEKDPHGRTPAEHRLWSRHHWTLEDNRAKSHQWDEALLTKDAAGWADDEPIWLREYLGHWTAGGDGTVYRYGAEKLKGTVTWVPQVTKDNPTGLPEEGAPWRLVGGLDLGFEDKTAFVVGAYSSKLRELRVVHDFSRSHMLVDDVADMLDEAFDRFGTIEKIFADTGNLAKMVVETLARRGFPIEAAERREKYDFIELVNSAFTRGEIKIIERTILEEQLLADAWDLSKGTREELARQGRLREDDAIPNDSADAFLYMFRGSLHQFGTTALADEPLPGTPEWVTAWERKQLAAARTHNPQSILGGLPRAPNFVRKALQRDQWLPTPGRYLKS
jgi:hypothetical protein